jgi:uncharacterized protein
MTAHPRPLPDADNEQFWQSCRAHKFLLQRCEDCGRVRFPPRPICARCRSTRTTWQEASGRGEVFSFTICHPPVLPAFADRTPYNVVVVRLDEGPLVVSNLVDAEADVGLPVQLCFVEIDEELTLPQFSRRGPAPGKAE